MEALHVLRIARKKLVYDFKNKEHEAYLPMFKFENNPELMKLAIENYFTSWINFHFLAWDKSYPEKSGTLIYKTIRELLLAIKSTVGEIDSRNNLFISKLIYYKIQLIDNLIISGETDNEKYNALLLEYEKDKVLFQREINRLKGGS